MTATTETNTATARCLLVTANAAEIAPLAARLSQHRIADVVIASSRRAARDAIASSSFDALLVDADLPDGDGLSLLKRSLRGAGAICFALAGDLSKERVLAAMRSGARDIFERPLKPDIICKQLHGALERQRRRRRAARRHARLRELSKRIIRDRRQVRRKVDVVCRDLVGAYRALAEKIAAMQGHTDSGTDVA